MTTRQTSVQPPGRAQACEVGSGVVKLGSSYEREIGSLPALALNQLSVNRTLTLGVAAPWGEPLPPG